MNRQIEREYRDALDALRFSREAKERMAQNLTLGPEERPVKVKRFRPLRAGLIAAAVCLALVGTAFAATAVYRLTVQTYEHEQDGQEYTGFYVYGKPVLHPLEDFTQEFQDDFAAWNHPSILFNQHFDTWGEARAYLGASIPIVWHSMDDVSWTGEYCVWPMYEMYGDGKIKYVEVFNNCQLNNGMTYTTDVFIYMPDYSREALTGEGWWKDSGDYQVLDSYTMANGCVAEVVVETKACDYEGQAVEAHDIVGAFMKEGLLYKVNLMGYIDDQINEAGLEEQLHQILDTFE